MNEHIEPSRQSGQSDPSRPVLVFGGAGFIGCNLGDHLARAGHHVRILDSLERDGSRDNLAWLHDRHGGRIESRIADLRDRAAVRDALAGCGAVFHLAAQVAVTMSVEAPAYDFDVNLRATVGLLEELRAMASPPPLVFTSTNKVYGCLPALPLVEQPSRWWPAEPQVAALGIGEDQPLSFRSPYGCSKGAADQYILDYAHTFGLPAVVFRMSCIYGPHQRGTEDQGWVAHFLLQALAGRGLTIYGDGKQVRDVLYVDDLVDALTLAWRHIDRLRGNAFNIGGGPGNTLSLLELLDIIERLHGWRPPVAHDDWRPGDQRYYVSDIRAFAAATGWRPRVPVADGLQRLLAWALEQRVAPRAELYQTKGSIHA